MGGRQSWGNVGVASGSSGLSPEPLCPWRWGPPGMAPIPRDPGMGTAGKCWLAEGAIHPLRPLRGEPVIHPGSESWERPPSPAKLRAPVGWCRGGRRGGTLGGFPGCSTPKGSGWSLGKRGLPQTPKLGEVGLPLCWCTSGWCRPRGIWGGQQGTVTPNCWPAALATPPLPRLLLTAAHSSGTAALFTPDRSAHGVTAGCCKPGPARNAAVAAGAVTPSAEPGLATLTPKTPGR